MLGCTVVALVVFACLGLFRLGRLRRYRKSIRAPARTEAVPRTDPTMTDALPELLDDCGGVGATPGPWVFCTDPFIVLVETPNGGRVENEAASEGDVVGAPFDAIPEPLGMPVVSPRRDDVKTEGIGVPAIPDVGMLAEEPPCDAPTGAGGLPLGDIVNLIPVI